MLRQLYEVFMRLVRPEHPCVLATAANLGSSLCGQGEPADARDADPARLGGAGCTKARARGGGYAHDDECELE